MLAIYIISNILNVILQTAKNIITVKGDKKQAAIINAIAYGFYNYVIILTMCDLPTLTKCLVVGACNLVGVYVVKVIEEKREKAKLWKIELATMFDVNIVKELSQSNIPYNYIPTANDEYTIFNIFCTTREQTQIVETIAKKYKCKTFVSENRYTI